MIEKRGSFRKELLEDVTQKSMVWMPYYRIQYDYSGSGEGSRGHNITGRGETALNAMICGCAKSENEITSLFRPNYLKHKTIRHLPLSEEIVGPTADLDLDQTLNGLLKQLNRVEAKLHELRSTLSKKRIRMRRYSMLVPLLGHQKKIEKELSEQVAGIVATKHIVSLCLNVHEKLDSLKVTNHNVFHYPTFVAKLKHKENQTERYIVINLVGSGTITRNLSCDKRLTDLCNRNNKCREMLGRLLP